MKNEKQKTQSTDRELLEQQAVDANQSDTQHQAQAETQPTSECLPIPRQLSKRRFSWIWNIFLIATICVGIFLMAQLAASMEEDGIADFRLVFSNIDVKYALIALAVFFVILFLDVMRYYVVTHAIATKALFKTSMKVMLIGKYYDNITPFSTGGQPVQIYYLHKKGYSGGISTAIVLTRFFVAMTAWLLVSFVFMFFNSQALLKINDPTQASLFSIAAWVGWSLTALLPLCILLFVVAPKLTDKATNGLVNLGSKLHIIKDKQKSTTKANKVVADFRSAISLLSKKPLMFFTLLFICILEWLVASAFPYFVMLMLYKESLDFELATMFTVMTLNFYATFSVALIPTPGNSGFVESSVLVAFGNIISGTFWVVFVWRFFLYYIYIIIGMGLSVFDVVRNFVQKGGKK